MCFISFCVVFNDSNCAKMSGRKPRDIIIIIILGILFWSSVSHVLLDSCGLVGHRVVITLRPYDTCTRCPCGKDGGWHPISDRPPSPRGCWCTHTHHKRPWPQRRPSQIIPKRKRNVRGGSPAPTVIGKANSVSLDCSN